MEIVTAVVLDSDWKITHLTLKYVFRCAARELFLQ